MNLRARSACGTMLHAVCTVAVVAGLLLSFSGRCAAQTEESLAELQIKAVFLYKFGSYVEWPARAFPREDSALAIGVMSADDLAEELVRVVEGRTVGGRPVTVKRVQPGDPLAGLHILFIGIAGHSRLGEVLSAAKGRPILIVTDSEGAVEKGSMINFVLVGGKVRFDVAPGSAGQGNLRISARLLEVARKVVDRPT